VPRGLGLKFSFWFTTLFTLGSVICLIAAYLFAAQSMRESDRQSLIAHHAELSSYLETGGLELLRSKLRERMNGDESELYVRVSSNDGHVLYMDESFDDLDEFSAIPPAQVEGKKVNHGLWKEVLSDE